jgi:4-amino-4-deoxy-L-arabinose transferase-like glycosyltransferase
MRPRTARLALALLLAIASILYCQGLGHTPAYLMHDEVNFSLQAQAIATTARDTNGRLLPVYFSEDGFEAGRDPVMIYVTALLLAVRPLSDATARMPTALIGVLSIALMFVVARRLFVSNRLALLAATLLAVTPAFFINSRLALSVAYPVPFILTWLWCLVRFLESGERRVLFAAGLALGAGVYSYVAALIMMPVYLAFTLLVVHREKKERAWAALLGFAVAMLPLVGWQLAHPDRYANLVQAYHSTNADQIVTLRGQLTAYWMFFSPDYLFLSGDARIENSTRTAGVFPLAAVLLIPAGCYYLWQGKAGSIGWCILAGFVTAPLATAVSGRLSSNRVLFAVPFGVLVATCGVTALATARARWQRPLAAALVASAVLQFGLVYAHYRNGYRSSSAPYFGGDARGAIQEVLGRLQDGPVYLDGGTPIQRYWRFYALSHGDGTLVDRPTYYDRQRFDLQDAGGGAFLICMRGDGVCAKADNDANWNRIAARVEPDGSVLFEVFQKRQRQ